MGLTNSLFSDNNQSIQFVKQATTSTFNQNSDLSKYSVDSGCFLIASNLIRQWRYILLAKLKMKKHNQRRNSQIIPFRLSNRLFDAVEPK